MEHLFLRSHRRRNCAINLGGRLIYYHSECGTFSEFDLSSMSTTSHQSPPGGRYWAMPVSDQLFVNGILSNYIGLLYGITDIAPAGLNLATLKDFVQSYGEDLTWDHFSAYDGEDVGSGLYIMRYEITDIDCYLLIGGASMNLPPAYIRLVSASDRDHYIDVRYESMDEFLAAGNGAASVPYTLRISRSDFQLFDGPSYDQAILA